MGFVLGVLIAQSLLGKSAMSLDLKGAIVNIPQITFLLLVQAHKARPGWEFCVVSSSHFYTGWSGSRLPAGLLGGSLF